MRIAALVLGLIAGLFVLLAPSALDIDLISPFLDFWATTSSVRVIGVVVWYAIAGAAMLGGVLATVTPGFAALLLCGAAVGWLGIGLSVPQLFTYQLIGPVAAAGLAALFAFLAGELQVRRRRLARRSRKITAVPLIEASEVEREAALRMDPLLMPRDEMPPPKRAIPTIPLTLSDVTVTERPAAEAPRWQDLDPPPRQDHSSWAEARRDPPARPEPSSPPPRSMGPREAARRRSELDIRPEPPVQRPQMAASAPAAPHRSGGGAIAAMAALGTVLGVGILLAGGYLLYRDGMLAGLFGPVPAAATTAAPTSEVPVVSAATTAGPVKAAAPATPAKLELSAVPAAAAAAPQLAPTATGPTQTEPAPAQVAAVPAAGSYDDPFRYCGAVGTIDHVDSRYLGPAFTEPMARALLIPTNSARDRVRWRCVDGAVLACTSYAGPVCDMAPTVTEMREFCERNPNVEQLMAPSGLWSCTDGRPQLPADASWPIDERGFVPGRWIEVPNPGAAQAG